MIRKVNEDHPVLAELDAKEARLAKGGTTREDYTRVSSDESLDKTDSESETSASNDAIVGDTKIIGVLVGL